MKSDPPGPLVQPPGNHFQQLVHPRAALGGDGADVLPVGHDLPRGQQVRFVEHVDPRTLGRVEAFTDG